MSKVCCMRGIHGIPCILHHSSGLLSYWLDWKLFLLEEYLKKKKKKKLKKNCQSSDITDKIKLYKYPTPLHEQDVTQGQFLMQSLIGLNSEFSFFCTSCHTEVKESSLPYKLPIAEGRIIGVMHFTRVLVLCEI